MAPLKFEDKIKEKLEHRAIEPSTGSWGSLSKQLDKVQDKKKGNKKTWLYSLAAVFVGVLILTSIFYKNPVAIQTNDQFVDRSKEIVKQNDTELVQKNDQNTQKVIENKEANPDANTVQEKIIVNSENKQTIRKTNKSKSQLEVELQKKVANDVIEREIKKNNIVAQNNEEKTNFEKQEEVLSISPEVINTKVADIVAQVEELQKNNTEVTDEEIDKLLRKAQRDITTERILKSNTVSASALLQDVEEEIDETFKQRVFEALKAGFQKVKSAVAEREN